MLRFICRAGFIFVLFLSQSLFGNIAVLGELTHSHVLGPGESFQGTLEILNMTGEIQTVRIYQTDYMYHADGSCEYDEPGSLPRSNAKWIRFSPVEQTLTGKAKTVVSYEIHVPEDTSLKGTYWSMLMVEPVHPINIDSTESHMRVMTVVRYGVQMRVNINKTGTGALLFDNAQLIKTDTSRVMNLDIVNTGERFLTGEIWMELIDSEGNQLPKIKVQKGVLLPGSSIRRPFDLTDFAAGTYKAVIIADCGNEDIFGIEMALKIEE